MNNASSSSYQSYLMSNNDNPNHLNHIIEFSELCRRIVLEMINEIVPPMINEAVSQSFNDALTNAFSSAMQGLRVDINRIVEVTCKQLNAQFHSSELSTFWAETFKEELTKSLKNIDLKLIIS